MANTKLADYQKQNLVCLTSRATAEGVQVLNLDNKTMMAFKLRGNTVEFSLSVMSPDEKKFRRKVGAYYALLKFYAGTTVSMAVADFETMCESVWDAYPI